MKNTIKTWKIAAAVAAGILAAAGVIVLVIRHLEKIKALAAEVRDLCLRAQEEFLGGDACCCCDEEPEIEVEIITEEPAEDCCCEEAPAEECCCEEAPAEECCCEEVPAEECCCEEVPVEEAVAEEEPKAE